MRLRIRESGKVVLIGLAVLCLVLSFACGKKGGAEKAAEAVAAAAGTVAPAGRSAQNDYMTPYLTDEKMAKFIESLKEDVNPFEVLFKGGQMANLRDIEKRAEEYNGFARKYGFADFGDYMTVWGRIMVGDMTIASQEWTKKTIQGFEETIKIAEENLKKPDLPADMKTIYEDQIKNAKESIVDMSKPDESPSLNAEDLALVAKYKAQIDEATKKYKSNPGN